MIGWQQRVCPYGDHNGTKATARESFAVTNWNHSPDRSIFRRVAEHVSPWADFRQLKAFTKIVRTILCGEKLPYLDSGGTSTSPVPILMGTNGVISTAGRFWQLDKGQDTRKLN